MAATDAITGAAYEDSDVLLMARVKVNVAGVATNLQQSHVSGITYRVWDKGVEKTAGALPLTVGSVVFNTLQTGSVWTADSQGYNFAFQLSKSYLPDGNRTYKVQVTFTLTGGTVFHVVWKITTINLEGQ